MNVLLYRLAIVFVLIGMVSPTGAFCADAAYDSLALASPVKPETLDRTVSDKARQRDIPIRVYLPAAKAPAPVILFSPGLGGSRDGYVYLGQHWAARGYVTVVLQHPGSDAAVWQGKPAGQIMAAMREAASAQNFVLRAKDVTVVLDQLDKWNRAAGDPLQGRLDLQHVGMAGHSFGAVTTQAVSGQTFMRGRVALTDARIKAAIAMSPSSPRTGDAKAAFGGVRIPWLLMTGTKDVAPIGNEDAPSRLKVFPALPPGGKYELVLNNGEHSAFTDRALPGDKEPRNPNHHRAILALSTAFWDAYLRGDVAAKAWLDGAGPATVLEQQDHWQKK